MATNIGTLDFNTILIAVAGGVLPAILWLLFWLREDSKHPESPFLITKTFLGGMCVVVLVIPFQKIVDDLFPGISSATLFWWAVIEEGFKFAVAYFIAIRVRDDDEPIDAMIFMITVALGFVALENTLYIVHPLMSDNTLNAISTGSLRFIGAGLLHVLSSAVIGVGLALSFFKKTSVRFIYTSIALVIAILIHTAFNIFVLNQSGNGTLMTFGTVWVGITMILILFEKAKHVAP